MAASARISNLRPIALVVDDEPIIRMCTAEMLDDLGFNAIEAGSAEEALELIAAQPVVVMITDLRMPGTTGAELVARVVEDHPGIGIVIASGADGSGPLAAEIPRLSKPFNFGDLETIVRGLGFEDAPGHDGNR